MPGELAAAWQPMRVRPWQAGTPIWQRPALIPLGTAAAAAPDAEAGRPSLTINQQARTYSLSWSLSCQAHKHLLSAGIEEMTRSPCCPCLQRPEGDGWCLVATQQSKTLKFLLAHLHGFPIVKPQWVRDSMRAQRPLTYADPIRVMCCPYV